MKLSEALQNVTESPAILKPTTHNTIAETRAKTAYKNCLACHEGMDWVMGSTHNGAVVRWSWYSMWALACADHLPWIKAAYDPDYLTWLDARVSAFRVAYQTVQQTLIYWDEIQKFAEACLRKEITAEQCAVMVTELEAKIDPEMIEFAPESLLVCLERIKEDAIPLSRELQRARWQPPVTWSV